MNNPLPVLPFVRPLTGRAVQLVPAFALVLGMTAAVQGVKISGPLRRPADGYPVTMLPSPDGSRVVFTIYRNNNVSVPSPDTTTLYSVPADRSQAPVQLNVGSPRFIYDFAISPDGERVVYLTDEMLFGFSVRVLRSLPIDGSQAAVRLNGDGTEVRFVISPDSARVVYIGDDHFSIGDDLYSVPIDGSQSAVELSHEPSAVESFALSPTGARVVYRTPGPNGNGNDLYSVPLDQSQAPVRLNDPNAGPSSLFQYLVSPDGSRVVYVAAEDAGVRELFSVPIDRSQPPVKLSGALASGGDVQTVEIAPDGLRVVYVADQDTDDVFELYSVPIAGGATVRLNGALVSGGDVQFHRISPDGTRVVYLADQDADEVLELHSAPSDGSQSPLKISGSLVAGGDVRLPQIEISLDGSRVAYVADQIVDETFELFVASITASQPVLKLNASLVAGGDVLQFRWSADGQRVVYLADQDSDDTLELFSVASDASQASVRLNEPLISGANLLETPEDVYSFLVHTDGSVLYTGNQDGASRDLYRVPIDGSAVPLRLNDPIPLGRVDGGVADARFTPDGRRVLYRASGYEDGATLFSIDLVSGGIERVSGPLLSDPFGDRGVQPDVAITPDGERVLYRAPQDATGMADLYSAPVEGGAPAIRLSDAASEGRSWDFRISPGGTRAVYRSGGFQLRTLHSVPIDGSGAAILLDSPLGTDRDVLDYRITSSGERVVFLEDAGTDEVFELYSVPIDGSQPALRLNTPLAGQRDVVAFEVDERFPVVVYLADQVTDEAFRLFSVRVDGSEPPVELSGSLGTTSDVLDFKINPRGTRVVFRADPSDEVIDLFGVPIDGSSPPALLNLSRPLADVLPDYQLSRDGQGVAYRSDQDTNEVFELFVASIFGGPSPVKRSGPLVSGGDVVEFELEQGDGLEEDHVVYRADQELKGVFELYSAKVNGSGAVAKLNGPLVEGGDVGPTVSGGSSLRITPNGRRVLYTADQDADDVLELFSRPIDGSGTARRESATLVPGGDVKWFLIGPSGTQVIYAANQDFAEAIELYRTDLVLGPRTRRAP